ncbi:MAG: hypothetical protein AAB217_05470 [Chloroflexota bacterium]
MGDEDAVESMRAFQTIQRDPANGIGAANFLDHGEAVGGGEQQVGHPGELFSVASIEVFRDEDIGEDSHGFAVAVAAFGGEEFLSNLGAEGVVLRRLDDSVGLAAF